MAAIWTVLQHGGQRRQDVPRLIVRYALTRDDVGRLVFRDDELYEIVGFEFGTQATDLEKLVCECEYHFISRGELLDAKRELQAAGFEVAPK